MSATRMHFLSCVSLFYIVFINFVSCVSELGVQYSHSAVPLSSNVDVIRTKRQTQNNSNKPKLFVEMALQNFTPINTTNETDFIVTNNHEYYNVSYNLHEEYYLQNWIDLNLKNASIHEVLSNSHKMASTVPLNFEFPFYGFIMKNITIATGGFLFMGEFLHSWLASTQYIAPLMGNFNPRLNNGSFIRYFQDDSMFVVEWKDVILNDQQDVGNFTFQTQLLANGDIKFVYKSVPIPMGNMSDTQHPVKIGLADAYFKDEHKFHILRRTIYEYHNVNLNMSLIRSRMTVELLATSTCVSSQDCTSCVLKKNAPFPCFWCEKLGHCSSGYDRKRQQWISAGCPKTVIGLESGCDALAGGGNIPPSPSGTPVTSTGTPTTPQTQTATTASTEQQTTTKGVTKSSSPTPTVRPFSTRVFTVPSKSTTSSNSPGSAISPTVTAGMHAAHTSKNEDGGMSPGGIVAIIIILVIVLSVCGWLYYAYKYPTTTSGQLLIKYRPGWKGRNAADNTRYTMALHM